jgi:DNA-binding transcriptional ArsR family regulator
VSLVAIVWAWEQETGSGTRKIVLVALADRHNRDTGECFPSVEALAAQTELGRRTVERALSELCDLGLVTRDRRRRKDGSLSTYDYRFPHLSSAAQPPATEAASPPAAPAGRNQEVDLQPSTTTSTEVVVADPPETPRTVFVDGRNLGYDALAEVCSIQPKSPRIAGIPAALNGTHNKPGIRDLAWSELTTWRLSATPEQIEQAIADLIRERAEHYRRHFGPEVELTPSALLKWWVDLPHLPSRRRGDGDAVRAGQAAQAHLDRIRGNQ